MGGSSSGTKQDEMLVARKNLPYSKPADFVHYLEKTISIFYFYSPVEQEYIHKGSDLCRLLLGFYNQINDKNKVIEKIIQSETDTKSETLYNLDFLHDAFVTSAQERQDNYFSVTALKFYSFQQNFGPFLPSKGKIEGLVRPDIGIVMDAIEASFQNVFVSKVKKGFQYNAYTEITNFLWMSDPVSAFTPPTVAFLPKFTPPRPFNATSICTHGVSSNGKMLFVLCGSNQLQVFPLMNNGAIQNPITVDLNTLFNSPLPQFDQGTSLVAFKDNIKIYYHDPTKYLNYYIEMPISRLVSFGDKLSVKSVQSQNNLLCVLSDGITLVELFKDFWVNVYEIKEKRQALIRRVKLAPGNAPLYQNIPTLFPNTNYELIPIEINGNCIAFTYIVDRTQKQSLYRVFSLTTGRHILDEIFQSPSSIFGACIDHFNACHWTISFKMRRFNVTKILYRGSIDPLIIGYKKHEVNPGRKIKPKEVFPYLITLLNDHIPYSLGSQIISPMYLSRDIKMIHRLLDMLLTLLTLPKEKNSQIKIKVMNSALQVLTFYLDCNLTFIQSNKPDIDIVNKTFEVIMKLPTNLAGFLFFNHLDYFINDISEYQLSVFVELFKTIENENLLMYIYNKISESTVIHKIPFNKPNSFSDLIPQTIDVTIDNVSNKIITLLIIHQRNLFMRGYNYIKNESNAQISYSAKQENKTNLDFLGEYVLNVINKFDLAISNCKSYYELNNSLIYCLFMNLIRLISPFVNYHTFAQIAAPYIIIPFDKLLKLSNDSSFSHLQYLIYVFGELAAELVRGGTISDFEEKYLWLLKSNYRLSSNDSIMNVLDSDEPIGFNDVRIPEFLSKDDLLNTIYKKFRPQFNKPAILTPEVRKMDRLSLLAFSKHLDCFDELIDSNEKKQISPQLKKACEQMMKIRNTYRKLVKDGEPTDDMYTKLMMLLRLNPSYNINEIDPNSLSDFVTSNYSPTKITNFIKIQQNRIKITPTGFALIDKVINVNLAFGEILSYTLSKIDKFEGLKYILQIVDFSETQQQKVDEFFCQIAKILETYPNNNVILMAYRFFRDVENLETIQNNFLYKIYDLHQKFPRNYALIALALSLSNKLNFVPLQIYSDYDVKNSFDWLLISEASQHMKPPTEFVDNILRSIELIQPNRIHFVLNTLYFFLPYISDKELEELFMKLLQFNFDLTSDPIISSEIIQFLRHILSKTSPFKEKIENIILNLDLTKEQERIMIGIFSIFGLSMENERPFSLIRKNINRTTVEFYYTVPSDNNMLYYSAPFKLNTPSKLLENDNKLTYTVSLYEPDFKHYDYFLKYFNLCVSEKTVTSITSTMYMQAFAYFCQFPDFVTKLTPEIMKILCDQPIPFSDLYGVVDAIKHYSSRKPLKDLKFFSPLQFKNQDFISYLTPQIKLDSDEFRITFVKTEGDFKGYFGIVSDSIDGFATRYTLVQFPEGKVYPVIDPNFRIPIQQSRNLQIYINPRTRIFKINNNPIPFPLTNSFRFIITVKIGTEFTLNVSNENVFTNSYFSNYSGYQPRYEAYQDILNEVTEFKNINPELIDIQTIKPIYKGISDIPIHDKLRLNFIIPPDFIPVHISFSTESGQEITLSMINGLYYRLMKQWETISLMRITNINIELVQPVIFKLFSIFVVQLESFVPSLLTNNSFPFSLKEPIWSDNAEVNHIYGSFEKEMISALKCIISKEEYLDLISLGIKAMVNSKQLHLLAYPNKAHKFIIPFNPNTIFKDRNAIITYNDFLGVQKGAATVNGNGVSFPYILAKSTNEIKVHFNDMSKYISILSFDQSNSWVFGSGFELLLLLKNFIFMIKNQKEKIIAKNVFLDCYIIHSPFIQIFLPQFYEFIRMQLPTSPIDQDKEYLQRLILMASIAKCRNEFYFINCYNSEYDILTNKNAIQLTPFFPEFFFGKLEPPKSKTCIIPYTPIDPVLLNGDYNKILQTIRILNKEYNTLSSFPFWLIISYWFRISEFWHGQKEFIHPTVDRYDPTKYVIRNSNQMNITVKITLNNPRTQIPYDLICTYSQSETFEDGEFLQGAQILRPFVVGQGNTFISLIGQGNTDPWKLFTIKLEYPEQRTIVDKSPYQVNIDEIHDVFISDMQQFACKWKESHTEELLQLFSRTQLQSPTFGDVESIAKSSSLCSQFSPNVVILRALLIHYYNYIRYKHRNNLNKQILDSLRKLISIDEAASGIIESIITPKECMITSPRYAPQMVFNRHAAQRIILDGKGETKWSMVSQLTQYVQKYKAEGLRYKYFPWHIQFEGESAIDAGGPGREVVVEVATSIFEPTTKLMVQLTQSNTFVPDEESTTRLNDYYTIGVYLGIIVRNGFSQDLPFANIVWKYLAGEKITKKDIMNEDSTLGTLFKNLNEDLITTNWIITGWNQKKILLPNHKDVKVEKDDIDQYIDEFINYRINSILPMLEQMRNGFRDNIGFKHHNLLSGCTLSRLAQGSGAISVQYLKSITTVTGFSDGMQNPIIQRFWRAVERLNQEQLKLLLKFITTFTRLPNSVIAPNFKLKIDNNVNVSGDPNQLLPSASTCFNLLHLPSYTDDEAAYEKIVYAITYCQTMENK